MLSWIKVSSPNVPSQTRGGPCDSVVVYYMVQSLDPYSFSFSHGSAQPISQSKTHLFPEDCIVYIKITTESECQLLRDNLKTTANCKKKKKKATFSPAYLKLEPHHIISDFKLQGTRLAIFHHLKIPQNVAEAAPSHLDIFHEGAQFSFFFMLKLSTKAGQLMARAVPVVTYDNPRDRMVVRDDLLDTLKLLNSSCSCCFCVVVDILFSASLTCN